jgi:hypothetical protein
MNLLLRRRGCMCRRRRHRSLREYRNESHGVEACLLNTIGFRKFLFLVLCSVLLSILCMFSYLDVVGDSVQLYRRHHTGMLYRVISNTETNQ